MANATSEYVYWQHVIYQPSFACVERMPSEFSLFVCHILQTLLRIRYLNMCDWTHHETAVVSVVVNCKRHALRRLLSRMLLRSAVFRLIAAVRMLRFAV